MRMHRLTGYDRCDGQWTAHKPGKCLLIWRVRGLRIFHLQKKGSKRRVYENECKMFIYFYLSRIHNPGYLCITQKRCKPIRILGFIRTGGSSTRLIIYPSMMHTLGLRDNLMICEQILDQVARFWIFSHL